jgi:hypothetical protein
VVLERWVTNSTIVPGFPGCPFSGSVFKQSSVDVMHVPSTAPTIVHLGDATLHLASRAD